MQKNFLNLLSQPRHPAASKIARAQGFSGTLLRLQSSPVYAEFCRRVYGRNLCQFNMLDEQQLQAMLAKLNLGPGTNVLDLGCGVGLISEIVSDSTGAPIIGLDFAEPVVEAAALRTVNKRGRVDFVTGDMNSLPESIGEFDVILSIDTLYFADDLEIAVQNLAKCLKPGGKIAAFYSCKRKGDAPIDVLAPQSSRLIFALKASGFSFESSDFSIEEEEIWKRARVAATELEIEFQNEGNRKTYEERIWEANRELKWISEGRSARAFYVAHRD